MAAPVQKGETTKLVEQANSPQTEYTANSIIKTRTFKGVYSVCVDSALPVGTLGSGDEAGLYVSKCVVTRERGRIASLVVVYEPITLAGGSGGFLLPEDEWDFEAFEINPKLEKHPRYAAITAADLDNVMKAYQGQSTDDRAEARAALSGVALELFNNLNRGQDSYYLAGIRYNWTYCTTTPPTITLGGFIQSPSGPGADYFSGSGMSSLRAADGMSYSKGIFKVTSHWLWGPKVGELGYWDPNIY